MVLFLLWALGNTCSLIVVVAKTQSLKNNPIAQMSRLSVLGCGDRTNAVHNLFKLPSLQEQAEPSTASKTPSLPCSDPITLTTGHNGAEHYVCSSMGSLKLPAYGLNLVDGRALPPTCWFGGVLDLPNPMLTCVLPAKSDQRKADGQPTDHPVSTPQQKAKHKVSIFRTQHKLSTNRI